jgi:uncharacterized lipoprotein YbaY
VSADDLRRRLASSCAIVGLLVSACSQPAATQSPAPATPPYVGKIWISTDAAAAPGTMRIFLSNGSLVMDSCGETYRLVRWRAIDERRIEWTEDTARIEAEIAVATVDRLQLRLRLVNETREENYRLADVPYVCPSVKTPAAQPRGVGILKGTVAYRERVALPADAVVDVWITDITPGIIVPQVITAETSIKSGGRQVPLPFELTFDPGRIVATHRYGVRAVIKSGGKVLFQSGSATPVITQGNPTQVQLILTQAGG